MGDGTQTLVCIRARGQEVRDSDRENDNFLCLPITHDLHRENGTIFC